MTDYQPPADSDEPPADGMDIIIGLVVLAAIVVSILWAGGVIRLPGA